MLKNRNTLRFRIYAVLAALGAIALGHGLITEEDLNLYLALAEAVLLLLVMPNTDRSGGEHRAE